MRFRHNLGHKHNCWFGIDGTVAGRYYRYYAYGETKSEQVSMNQAYKYTGKPLDTEKGLNLYYFGARYYNPAIGRWLAVDPQASKNPSLSPYLYCNDNPLKYVDPNGEVAGLIGGAALVAGIVYYILATPDNVQAPQNPIDIHKPTFGERVLQHVFAIMGTAGTIGLTNSLLSKISTTAGDAVAAKISSAADQAGSGASWTTYRRNYWKSEARDNPGRFKGPNLERTEKGLAPQRPNPETGKPESRQLHHIKPQKEGGTHNTENLMEVWPDEHKIYHMKPEE